MFSFCSFGTGNTENGILGKSIEELISQYGKPDKIVEKIIDKNYIGYEEEPDYSKYFSQEELEKSIIINIASWKRKRKTIIVWLKTSENGWISFSSLEYFNTINF
jgi:hypothetical protein